MTELEFMNCLEEFAKRIYRNDLSLPTTFDKVEEFYLFLSIDDPHKFRKKMKEEDPEVKEVANKLAKI